MLTVGYYGYVDPAANKTAVEEMHTFIKRKLKYYRRHCPKGQFICVGDTNSAQYTVIDTDRTEPDTILREDEVELESDHHVLDDLLSKGFGLHDILRERYWNTRFVSRNVQRKTTSGNLQTNRLLDRILVSKQASAHIGTKVGIYQGAVMAKVDMDDEDTMHGEVAGESDNMMVGPTY